MSYKHKSTSVNGISKFLNMTLNRGISVDDIILYTQEFRKHHAPDKQISKYPIKSVDYCQKNFAEFSKFVKNNLNLKR